MIFEGRGWAVAVIVRLLLAADKEPAACVVLWKNVRPWTKGTVMRLAADGLVIVCLVRPIHVGPSPCVRPSSTAAKKVCWRPIVANAAGRLGEHLARTATVCWKTQRSTTPRGPAVCPTDGARNTTCETVLNLGDNFSVNCNHPTVIPIWPPVKRSPWSAVPSLPVAFPTNLVAPCHLYSA